ncbi:hypothetical protein SAGO17_00122 [Mimivirus AB-566-O17]|uniref:Uncharacterized protein n=1 Tax=Mimivirus AB-566-O17 TaxID=1988039 RepID=A0A1X9VNZ6_9VIRU|nr:hypothetical protein SAGO17_00122 [Mimivirus AB-566-O17]
MYMDNLYINELERFVNELTLSFDEFSNVEKDLEAYIKTLRDSPDFFMEQKEKILHQLKCHSDDFERIVNAKGKVKGDWFLFLDRITLFNNLMNW